MKTNNNYNVRDISDKKIWENFNLSVDNPAYFQSWNWGKVQKRGGVDVIRLGFFEGSNLIAISQIFDVHAKRGHFLHVRQGPVISFWNKKRLDFVINSIKKIAYKKNASFIRISPLLEENNLMIPYLEKIGFKDSPIHNVDAENRWILKLNSDLEAMLRNMRKTTRYLIRKGENLKINIVRSQNIKDVNKFLGIYNETAKIKNFVPHSLIKEEFQEFSRENRAHLYMAYQDSKLLCGAIVIYYGKEAIYRHGATSSYGRNTPASYLVQWEAVKDAVRNAQDIYNFWGIAKDDNPKNPWFGLSQFKKGFNGERKDFIHSMDLPLNKTYWISYLIDYYTKIKKGYNI